MDQQVEKLEDDLSSLNVGQQHIMDKLNELFEKLGSHSANIEPEVDENSRAPLQNHEQSFPSKLVKLDFPLFNGEEDTTSWTCRRKNFFQFHQTPEEERVAIAFFHLEGDAQLWCQLFK
ncbi:hypothetical protein AMTRI_Chr07g28190 [Amborella trichopoda]